MKRTVTHISGLDEIGSPPPVIFTTKGSSDLLTSRPKTVEDSVGRGYRPLFISDNFGRVKDFASESLKDKEDKLWTTDELSPLPNGICASLSEDKEDKPSTTDELLPLHTCIHSSLPEDSFSTTSAITLMLQASFDQDSFSSAGRASPAETVDLGSYDPKLTFAVKPVTFQSNPMVHVPPKEVTFSCYNSNAGRKSPHTPALGKSILKKPASLPSVTPISTRSFSSDIEGVPPKHHPDDSHMHSGPAVSPISRYYVARHFT